MISYGNWFNQFVSKQKYCRLISEAGTVPFGPMHRRRRPITYESDLLVHAVDSVGR